jgi:hypothetical protein
LAALIDFENRRLNNDLFFPDVDSRFKFCVFIIGGVQRKFKGAQCSFFLSDRNRKNQSAQIQHLAEDHPILRFTSNG